ncbi:hypothetical protein ACFHYQ_16105 [Sphaerimonospora cavernae]|uniref:Uncharacterized protein n=1 Tax=Sphaerimonospora cavernae TaxID=1740611 RepID=A0ABV6U5U5_9ACTN
MHRLFLPAALLATATPQTAALLVEQFAWQTADQFHAGFRYRAEGVRVLAAPEWLGDDEADVIARREPYNDGPGPATHARSVISRTRSAASAASTPTRWPCGSPA